MPERQPYLSELPGCIPLPSDPRVPLTREQLNALFPNKEANQRFISMLVRLTHEAEEKLQKSEGDNEQE